MDTERSGIIRRLQSRTMTIEEFNFDALTAPPLYSMFTQSDIDQLYNIATSVRYSGNARKKYQAIDAIMKPRGFVKLSAGTNRVCYKCLENNQIVAKVAADAVGIFDNPREFQNQFKLKPFVTKIFEVDPTGVIAIAERVIPITSREEYSTVANDMYDLISKFIIGKYIMADIGSRYFMNAGTREGFGVVLLDFPYLYELDGNKLYCKCPNPQEESGICGGLLDYDDGFNEIRCTKCGTRYRVRELAKSVSENKILMKGGQTTMKVSASYGNVKVPHATDSEFKPATSSIKKEVGTKPQAGGFKVSAGYTGSKPKITKNEKKGDSDYRQSRGSARGIVKSNANPKTVDGPKITVKTAKDSVMKFESYDAEEHIMIFSDGANSVAINSAELPEDFVQILVENSSDYAALKSVLDDKNKEVTSWSSAYKKLEAENKKLKDAGSKSDDTDLQNTIADLTEQLEKSSDELTDIKAKYEKKIKQLDNALKKEKANSENVSALLAEANTKLESGIQGADYVVVPAEVDADCENSIYELYSTTAPDLTFIEGRVYKMSTFSNVEDDSKDMYIITFPNGNDEYMSDGDGNIIAIDSINGIAINDLFKVESADMEAVEAPVGAAQK